MFFKPVKVALFVTTILLSFTCVDLSADSGEKVISEVLALYFKNNVPQAKKRAEKAAKQLLNNDGDPGAIAILAYLAGNKIKQSKISLLTEQSPDLWALAVIGMFAKEIKETDDYFPEDLEYYFNNYEVNVKALQTKEAKRWAPRVKAWEKWVKAGYPSGDGIEPLLLTRSKRISKKISELTLEEYIKSREPFANRPRPIDLVFDEKKIKSYMNTLTEDQKQDEMRRYNYLKDAKDYLVKLFERSTYFGPIKGNSKIKIKTGAVIRANNIYFSAKRSRSGRSKKSYRCFWKDLKFEQYENFFCYFAARRKAMTGATNISKEKTRAYAAEDYRLLAALCDWFGEYEKAIKYANKSIETYPKVEDSIGKLLLGGD